MLNFPMRSGESQHITVAQISARSFWGRPVLRKEIFRPDLDEMIIRNTNKGGKVATRSAVEFGPVDEHGSNGPAAEIIDLRLVESEVATGKLLDIRDRLASAEEAAV